MTSTESHGHKDGSEGAGQAAEDWARMNIFFFGLFLEKICPLFKYIAQLGSRLPRW